MPSMLPEYIEPPDQEIRLPSGGPTYAEKLAANSIAKLMKVFGEKKVPISMLEEDDKLRFMIEDMGFKGTYNEAVIAKLYYLALKKNNIKAAKLIMDIQHPKHKVGGNTFVVNFITPAESKQSIEIKSDSWTVPVQEDITPQNE